MTSSSESIMRAPAGRTWLSRLFLAAAGVVLAAAIAELAVRLFMPVNLDFYNWRKIKRPSSSPGAPFEYIPGSRNDFYVGVPVQINSIGLRDNEIDTPKPPGTVRILVIGDSVTFGYGVPLEDTYLKVLEARLNAAAPGGTRYEVINAGMEGTGLDRYYDVLDSSAAALEPDLILIAMTMNDIADYDRRGHVPDERSYQSDSLPRRANAFLLFHSQAYLRSYLRLKSLLYRFEILDFDEEHWYEIDILKPPTDALNAAWKTSRELLSDIAEMADARGYPLAVAVFPMEVQLDEEAVERYRRELRLDVTRVALSGEPQRQLLGFGAEIGVPVVDLLPAFRAARQPDLFLRGQSMLSDPVHPSIAGHRVAAEALLAFFREQPRLGRPLKLSAATVAAGTAAAP